jgi:hypothetical protein
MNDYEIVGPFESHRVIVGGHRVPFLEAQPMNGGIISLTLDHRYVLDVPVADADRVIPFIADCIAVALGYTCHPRPGMEPLRSTPFQPTHGIDWMEADAAT